MLRPRPRLYCSRCLEFDNTRFDGAMVRSDVVRALIGFADIVHDCPEVGIGLGVPRRSVRIVSEGRTRRLVQPDSGLDLTESMEAYVTGLLERIGEVAGLILKSRSPTCGMGDVKIYPGPGKVASAGYGDGFLGAAVKERFGLLAVEDEARLLDPSIRDHFLSKLFTLARFREARASGRSNDLVEFQTRHKLLLMAYSQKELKEMGRAVASQKGIGMQDAWKRYALHLSKALGKGPRHTSHRNVLLHSFGYVSDKISREERVFFLDLLDMYEDDRTPLVTLKEVLRAYIIRFDVDYLKGQYYFEPYPMELAPGHDPKRGRLLWK